MPIYLPVLMGKFHHSTAGCICHIVKYWKPFEVAAVRDVPLLAGSDGRSCPWW